MPLTKLECARRLIDAAIRQLFAEEDPLAVHLLAVSVFQVLRDLAAKEQTPTWQAFSDHIVPGKEGKVWEQVNRFASYLKHANRDPEAILHDFNEEANGLTLLVCVKLYRELGGSLTPEMQAISSWVATLYPDFVKDEYEQKTSIKAQHGQVFGHLSKPQQAELGRKLLETFRKKAQEKP